MIASSGTRALAPRTILIALAGWLSACALDDAPTRGECEQGADGACLRSEKLEECICPAIYDPVCGQDGKTYGNACEAGCGDVPVAHEGECEAEGCFCPALYDPVCGEDGKTYGNACEAGCADVPVAHDGECEAEGCFCPALYDPVCGENGKTYGNSCEAGCADVPVAYEGECEAEGCFCPALYDPVCGEDGITYGNSCEAGCADVPVAYEGECKPGGGEGTPCKSNADCTGGTVCHPPSKTCQPECAIACLVYDPVCGTDGVTYGCGEADAHCHGIEVAHDGECANSCACTKEYQPVCGVDGQTYGNRCMAGCAGVAIAHEGECGGGCLYEGQSYKPGDSFPASDGCNTCSCGAAGSVACTEKACACDYSAPGRSWVAKSPERCATVRFACAAGQRPFFDDCGCGCEPDVSECSVGGCSGQLCVGPGDPGISTCEFRPEYACYRTATCALQADGRCGWTQSDELLRCLDEAS